MTDSIKPLPEPKDPVDVYADSVNNGLQILPIDRIKLYSASEWEKFVFEWANYTLKDTYVYVGHCGGSGDMGRDVVGYVTDNGSVWDNFQCKHYNHALYPKDIWTELGKLVYYTYMGEFTYPRFYYFVAPRGVGTKLLDLFRKPELLKKNLKEEWVSECRSKITSTATLELEGELLKYLDTLDFGIFKSKPLHELIEEHSKTKWYAFRFGGGLPSRPESPRPPEAHEDCEAEYIAQLYLAYGDHLKTEVASVDDLGKRDDLAEHLHDSRVEFFSAEALRTFSRDTLPGNAFERLQDEIHDGVRDDVRARYNDGYARVLAVVKTARSLSITDHPLISRMHVRDRGGICHQLANDGKVKWVKKL